MLAELSKTYWRITTLRESPQNTPQSSIINIVLALIFWLLVGIQWLLADVEHKHSITDGFLAGGCFILMSVLFSYILLYFAKLTNRLIQTLSSLFAVHIILHIVAFPLIIIAPWITQTPMPHIISFATGVIYLLITLILSVWQFIAIAHIYMHALSTTYMSGLIASFGLLACNILIISIWR